MALSTPRFAQSGLHEAWAGRPALIEALVDESTTDESIEAALTSMATSSDPTEILRLLASTTGEVTRRRPTPCTPCLTTAPATWPPPRADGFALVVLPPPARPESSGRP
ncbi:MAG TPA: hypothetical protein VGD29_20735 [Actinoplanes sp.]